MRTREERPLCLQEAISSLRSFCVSMLMQMDWTLHIPTVARRITSECVEKAVWKNMGKAGTVCLRAELSTFGSTSYELSATTHRDKTEQTQTSARIRALPSGSSRGKGQTVTVLPAVKVGTLN